MATNKLNALVVDNAHRKGEPVLLGDGGGLYFRKQTSDGAAWTLRYSFAGKERWLSLGNYPDMSLAVARIEARGQRVLVDRGIDPAAERRKQKEEHSRRDSFKNLCEMWFKAEVEGRVKHTEVPRRYLDKYLIPKLGRKIAADVTAQDLAELLDREKQRAPAATNDLLRFARRIFAFGVRRQVLRNNPAADLSPRLDGGGIEHGRERALTLRELAELFEAIRNTPTFGGENLLAIKLLLALCVRKGELIGARWSEFDLDGETDAGPAWRIPASRTKTGENLDIPLVPDVIVWLKGLQQVAAGSEWVFPKRRRHRAQRVAHMGIDTLNVAVARVEHGLPPFTLHDLRRTARTQLAALGVRREVAEKCLGHKLQGVEGTYDRHDYFKERRLALTQWTNLIVDAERPCQKITPIRVRLIGSNM